MRLTLLLTLSTLMISVLKMTAQFEEELVATFHLDEVDRLEHLKDNELVLLRANQLTHIFITEDDNFEFTPIEDPLNELSGFQLSDIDRDGDLDIIAYGSEFEKNHMYLYENGSFEFQTSPFAIEEQGSFLHVQDFDGDGYDDYFKDRILYKSVGPNEVEQLTNYVGLTLEFDFMHFVDYNRDGQMDVFYKEDDNIGFLELNSAGKLEKVLINLSIRAHETFILKNGEETLFLYQDLITRDINRLVFDAGSFSTEHILDLSALIRISASVNIDNDQTEELVYVGIIETFVLDYDTITNTFSLEELNTDATTLTVTPWLNDGTQQFLLGSEEGIENIEFLNSMYTRDFYRNLALEGDEFLDIDGDGFIDIIDNIPNTGVRVKRYLGDRAFGDLVEIPDLIFGSFIDVDGDNDLDFVKDFIWYENLGGLEFSTEAQDYDDVLIYPDFSFLFVRIIYWFDFDEDGDLDPVTYNQFGKDLSLHVNENNEEVSSSILLGTNAELSGDEIYLNHLDIDKDGDLDFLISTHSGSQWFEQISVTEFEFHSIYDELPRTFYTDIGDINLDGYIDVAVGSNDLSSNGSGEITVHYGGADGPGTDHHRLSIGKTDGVRFGDVMGSNRPEIIYANKNYLGLAEYVDEDTYIKIKIDDGTGINNRIELKDVDSDGDLDLITKCESCFASEPGQDRRVSYYINNSDLSSQVNEEKLEEQFVFYPNPANNRILISRSSEISKDRKIKYRIYDMNGRLMQGGLINGFGAIELDIFLDGIYNLILEDSQTNILLHSSKLVILRK